MGNSARSFVAHYVPHLIVMQKCKLIGILLCLFGLVPLWFSFVILYEHLPFWSYSTTEGTVARFEVIETNLTPASKGGADGYMVDISYTYEVAGKEFSSRSIAPSETWYNGDSTWLKKKKEKFNENGTIRVWFDPDIHSRSFIDTSYGPLRFLLPMAFAIIIIGILIALGKLQIATKE